MNDESNQIILFRFSHGLGDSVQFLCVLATLKAHHPGWIFDVVARRGSHSLFRAVPGLCRNVYIEETGSYINNPGDYTRIVDDVQWWEDDRCYADGPATKSGKYLRQHYGIVGIPERPRVEPSPVDLAMVDRYAATFPTGRFVCLHYQGNTATERKNLGHDDARVICEALITRGITPVILDWDRRSPLPDGKAIFCPDAGHPLWGVTGTGDGWALAALISRAAVMVGIDSGPAHVAQLTDTPTVMVWTGHHPVQFADPIGTVVHAVPDGHWGLIRGEKEIGRSYFREHYRFDAYQDIQGIVEMIDESLGDPDPDTVPGSLPRATQETGGYLSLLGGPWAFDYERVGHDRRRVVLDSGGIISAGGGERERRWAVNRVDGRYTLAILGDNRVTCRLRWDAEDGAWGGRWDVCERMPIRLVPLGGDGGAGAGSGAGFLEWLDAGGPRSLAEFPPPGSPPVAGLPVLAIYGPIPPAMSGCADYLARLALSLPLGGQFDVRVNPDPAGLPAGGPDACLYQLGNNPLHIPALEVLRDHPGVVTIHDINMSGMQTHLDEVCELATRIVVHSRHAASRIPGPYRDKVEIIPFGADPHPHAGDLPAIRATRAMYGLPGAGVFLIGVGGIVHETKLVCEAIEAFASAGLADAMLVIAGPEDDGGHARRRAEGLGLTVARRVRFIGLLPTGDFADLMAACDVGICLRRPPTNGETSAAVFDFLRAGVPVIASDIGSFTELPDEIVTKIRPGDEVQGVAEALTMFAADPADPGGRSARGRAGLEYVKAHHGWERVAGAYGEILMEPTPTTFRPRARIARSPATGRRFMYERVGHDRRMIVLEPDGRIGEGAAEMERWWRVDQGDGGTALVIGGDDGVTCRLHPADGRWEGRWLIHERMPIRLEGEVDFWRRDAREGSWTVTPINPPAPGGAGVTPGFGTVQPYGCLFYRGGLGDLFERYVQSGRDAGYVAGVLDRYPGARIDVICCQANPAVAEFFAHHPGVCEVHHHPEMKPVGGFVKRYIADLGAKPFREAFDLAGLEWASPPVYLSNEEREFAEEILAGGPFVAFHPFAGEPDREWAGKPGVDIVRAIDWICDHPRGCRCLLLGGPSTRAVMGIRRDIREAIDYERPGLVNLVGRSSFRLQAHLARRAEKVIGSMSCYATIAQAEGIGTFVLAPTHVIRSREFFAFSTWEIARRNETMMLDFSQADQVDLESYIRRFLDGSGVFHHAPEDDPDGL